MTSTPGPAAEHHWTLSGFADEIDPDLDVQLATLAEESLSHLELRSAWGVNVADLEADHIEAIASRLSLAGVAVSSIGSPIGKVPVTAPLDQEVARLRRVIDVAHRLGTSTIRIFSFFIPRDAEPEAFRERVLEGMAAFAQVATEEGVILAHENEKEIYGDRPERCEEILRTINSPALRATFDAANFVQCGVHPFRDAYPLLRPYLHYVQIKDALWSTGEVVPAGNGDGEVRETLAALRDSGFIGVFSLEPHLASAGRFGGFSGPARFRTAVQALVRLLEELGVAWR